MTGRKERKKKIHLRLWDSNPQPLAYMDKGTTISQTLVVIIMHVLQWPTAHAKHLNT